MKNKKQYNKKAFPRFTTDEEVPESFIGPCYIVETNALAWFKNKKPHRLDGPAVIWLDKNDNVVGWYWMKDNTKHRIGGPAYWQLGYSVEYIIEGKYYNENEYWNHPSVQKDKFNKILDVAS